MKPTISHNVDISASYVPQAKVYLDTDGLPVMYDVSTHDESEVVKRDTVSLLSHELLSPLTLIKGYTCTLMQLDQVMDEEQKERCLKGIESASNRLIKLLENLRDITQLEEIGIITTDYTNLYHLLLTTISEIQSQVTSHVIRLQPSVRLPKLKIDPGKIIQVVDNLVGNAIKYSPKGSDIDVKVCLVKSKQELKKLFGDTPVVELPCLIMSVADNGIGIPEDKLDAIFEKFCRLNNRLTSTTPGIGLGLYICKIIVEAHGGHIWAKNKPEGGSIFSFSLPID